MSINHRTKQEQMFAYRREVSSLIRLLICDTNIDGKPVSGYTLTQLASFLNLTVAQMSRVYHGVCTLSGPAFMELRTIYYDRFCTSWLQ